MIQSPLPAAGLTLDPAALPVVAAQPGEGPATGGPPRDFSMLLNLLRLTAQAADQPGPALPANADVQVPAPSGNLDPASGKGLPVPATPVPGTPVPPVLSARNLQAPAVPAVPAITVDGTPRKPAVVTDESGAGLSETQAAEAEDDPLKVAVVRVPASQPPLLPAPITAVAPSVQEPGLPLKPAAAPAPEPARMQPQLPQAVLAPAVPVQPPARDARPARDAAAARPLSLPSVTFVSPDAPELPASPPPAAALPVPALVAAPAPAAAPEDRRTSPAERPTPAAAGDVPQAPPAPMLSSEPAPDRMVLATDLSVLAARAAPPSIQALAFAPPPHDFAALVDRLVEARQALAPAAVTAAVAHADFGRVTLNFRSEGDALSVSMASADPTFAPAVQAAAQTFSTNANLSDNQAGSQQRGDQHASASGQQTGSGQPQPQSQPQSQGQPGEQPSSQRLREAGTRPGQTAMPDDRPASDKSAKSGEIYA